MKLFKMFATVLSLAVLCLLAVPTVAADDWNKETAITFSQPIEVPGVGAQILPAGTYIFKLVGSDFDRHIVQILSQDKSHVYTTILAIPNLRMESTDNTVITFTERPAGQPQAIKAWFYPGRKGGDEFVYAKPRAIELAKETNEPVLATPIELTAAPIEALKAAPVETITPKGEPVQVAAVESPLAAETLPKTASPLPLIGLIGLLSFGAGLGLMYFSKRIA